MSTRAHISVHIANSLGQADISVITMLVTATVTATTVLGKAMGKHFGISYATRIVDILGIILSWFSFKKK